MSLPPFHLHPDVLLLAAALEGSYLLALARLAPPPTTTGEPSASGAQRAAFTLGVLTVLAASSWPIHDLAEGYLLSVHMGQHLLLSLVAPPLLIMGTPTWLARRLLRPRPLKWAMRRFGRPLSALILFNAVLVLTHWPLVVDWALGYHLAHFGVHALIFGSSLLMWWQVLSPLPELPALSYPGRMLYLFLQSLLPTVPASFLTFGSTVIYPFYAAAPRIWAVSPLTDQLIAGLMMKLVGGLILWGAIAVFFFRWWSEEQSEGWDALAWRDVEREVRSELSKR
ncbi:MAG: cytochrome c oxidase assembly protein [Actinobacteria bacterium]|nr:cytochrome c oxidase assembly protein [Actinomycetota bacterium]